MSDSGSDEIRRLYLNGQWIEPKNPLSVTNPSTGEVLAKVGTVSREEVRRAMEDAAAAWPAWRATPGRERGRRLDLVPRRP